jgi:diadenosine tetraphosphatase ApaH/serine/threonine PP2A family protein phosphatase
VRYLIVTDIHSNLQALDAVLAEAGTIGYDHVLLLGDLVGYGGDPAPVIDRALALSPLTVIRGNHDKVCAGLESPATFNDTARLAAEWTHSALGADHLAALAELAKGPVTVSPELEICHGAPFDEDYYIFDERDAERSMRAARGRICLYGHTHVPALFSVSVSEDPFTASHHLDDEYALPRAEPALINVGAVGQPRDRDPRAAYGILDLERATVRMRRVAYDVEAAQTAIRRAGLPEWLADRLSVGQ